MVTSAVRRIDVGQQTHEPFVGELHALAELALRCELDADRSFETFAKRNPRRFVGAWKRLQRLCAV